MGTTVKRVLFAAAEVAPFAKAGGLADVAAGLPKALAALGVDIRVVMPRYAAMDAARGGLADMGLRFRVAFDGVDHVVRVFKTTLPGSTVPVYCLDHPHYEGAGDIYYQDVTSPREQQQLQVERFLFFSRAVPPLLAALAWRPDIVHCNDWHTAALPAMMRGTDIASVYTIHNLVLQGTVAPQRAVTLSQLPAAMLEAARLDGRAVNLAALGIRWSDAVNTVSPSYAREVMTPAFGAGLDRVLTRVPGGVVGILNGIDTTVSDPAHDAALWAPYSAEDPSGKRRNQQELRATLGMTVDGPVFGMVSRLTDQKGIDLVCAVAPRLVEWGCGLVVVGTGTAALETSLRGLAARFPTAVHARLRFDAAFAQRVYAGSDFFLMPSRFEPCGLGQMIALRYGTVPVVHATGGLRDTVVEAQEGNGFVFTRFTPAALLAACRRAIAAYRDADRMRALVARGMRMDFSWGAAARQYLHLYADARTRHAATQRTP